MTTTTKATKLPIRDINDLILCGKNLAQSGMMGRINPPKGFVIAAICQQTGMSYNEYAETYHIVGDRPTMRADTMLANFLKLGGEYKIIQRDGDRAAVWMKFGAAEGTFTFTADEAYEEPVAYACKESEAFNEMRKPLDQRKIKAKYKSPRSRMQMLWARVVSDGVRTVCPLANRGTYTPEEVEDFDPSNVGTGAHDPEPYEPEGLPDTEENYSACPIPGPLFGQLWTDMDNETLAVALGLEHESMLAEHKNQIAEILQDREGSEQ